MTAKPKPAKAARAVTKGQAMWQEIRKIEAEATSATELCVDDIPMEKRCTILDLTQSKCRWPIGNPQSPDFFFCGGKPIDGYPYCGCHCRMAYQKAA